MLTKAFSSKYCCTSKYSLTELQREGKRKYIQHVFRIETTAISKADHCERELPTQPRKPWRKRDKVKGLCCRTMRQEGFVVPHHFLKCFLNILFALLALVCGTVASLRARKRATARERERARETDRELGRKKRKCQRRRH